MYTVLVVENDTSSASISYVLSTRFSEECTFFRASCSRDIFQYLSHHNVDIILLDMDTPGIIGTEMCRFIQRNGNQRAFVPVLSMDRFDHTQFENAPSVIDYLIKPFSQEELILTMEECLQNCQVSPPVFESNSYLSRMDMIKARILQYIQDHYNENISMQDAAQAMNYSDTHFCRLFKQYFGVNFSVYLNEFRVEQAKGMLASSDTAVKEVGRRCGYGDTSYFIRVFKRHTGTTPSDYRIEKFIMTAKKSDKSQNSFIS